MIPELFLNPLTLAMTASTALFVISVFIGAVKLVRAEAVQNDCEERSTRMPALSKLVQTEEELGFRREELAKVNDEIDALRREQAEIRRNAVDAQHYEALAEETKRAYDNLSEQREAIDLVRDDYESAKKDLAEVHHTRDQLIRDRDSLQQQIADLQTQLANAESAAEEIAGLTEELERLKNEIAEQEDLRDERERARIALDQLARLKSDMEKEIEDLPPQIEDLEIQKDILQREVTDIVEKRKERGRLNEEVDNLEARKAALHTHIEELEAKRKSIPIGPGAPAGSDGETSLTVEEAKRAVEDLWTEPSCLFDGGDPILASERRDISEQEALQEVHAYLNELCLSFQEKHIKRFHTSLKISRVSPLTVLAGISGTGKSLLPQRYADAMGIPFLKVAVQPRWDSPQDLLGFYNYLEKKYKATDLARALAYVDPHSLNGEFLDQPMDNRLLLVLMDEMNLARIEYYFSEFLSRLENRPGPSADDPNKLRPSRIEIDVPVAEGKGISIYPGHNTLFVGTMNEDESTQALSEKVLDRGNAISFKKPDVFIERIDDHDIKPSGEYLSFSTWKSWYREQLPVGRSDHLKDLVTKLNTLLDKLDRPFGHRIFHAISAYAANHPDADEQGGVETALADMMEMRVLPKLRGIELDAKGRQDAVNGLAAFVRDDLRDDGDLANRIANSRGRDDVFTWRG
jgi:hypothetical protein